MGLSDSQQDPTGRGAPKGEAESAGTHSNVPAGAGRDDAEAEYRRELADGYWDPPSEFDPPAPTKHGWAPDPYPNGGLI